MSTAPLLEISGLRAGFGANTVLHGVDVSVRQSEIAAILGLNGAGKSVTMKVVAGIVPAWEGSISFAGERIEALAAEDRVSRGIAHVTQGRQVFPELTVEENLRLGAYVLRRRDRGRYGPLLDGLYQRFPRLAERRGQAAGTLSGGEQAILALARALISEPRLLLIDEPTAGLAPVVVEGFLDALREVNRSGVTMLLVEQHVPFALSLADRAHIMQRGRIVYASEVAALNHDEMIRYLGIGRLLTATSEPEAPVADRATTPKKRAAPVKKRAATAKKRVAAPAKKKAAAPRKAAAKRVAR